MVSTVHGSAFAFDKNGVFYSAIDYGARTTKTSGQNDTAIAAALAAMVTAGGGVLLVPHGISHSFDPVTDFPVTANALMVWILTGNSFIVYSNQEITSDFGDDFAAAFFETPSAVSYRVVDANPPTYTYKFEVYDDAGTPVITGSSFDLCWFLPGGTDPVMALARNGAKIGALFCFAGLDVTGVTEVDTLKVTGASQFPKQIITPLTGESHTINDATRYAVLDHAATIAALTLTLPAAPLDGQPVRLFSRSIVTALTLNAGAGETIATGHGVTTIAAAGSVEFVFQSSDSKWYRVG